MLIHNVYEREFTARCPNNGVDIRYNLKLFAESTIFVEEIVKATAALEPSYHEELADDLFEQFAGRQILIAYHHGVTIRTFRGFA